MASVSAPGSTAAVVAVTAVATAALLAALRWYLYPRHGSVIPSPLHTVLPRMSPAEVAALDYTPDAFPGARDVSTPYGSIRVYEFGPETGRKVIFVHGISTSCQTLTEIARGLVARAGCRVMLFDLFGRGFSDGVGDLPHDARLYVTQMLLALASSPLPSGWMGGGDAAIDVVGYSLGGGVAVHFAASFPRAVRSLVLLAPAGLIRAESFGALTRFVFQSGAVPERLLAAITRRRLQQPIASSAKRRAAAEAASAEGSRKQGREEEATASTPLLRTSSHSAVGPVEMAAAEVDDPRDADYPNHEHEQTQQKTDTDTLPLNQRVMRYVRWMLFHHEGFVPAFMSCIRDAPLVGQHDAYRALASSFASSSLSSPSPSPSSTATPSRRICVVLGADDEIIDPDQYEADALPLLGGRGAVHLSVVPGGHDFVMTHPAEALAAVYDFWGVE